MAKRRKTQRQQYKTSMEGHIAKTKQRAESATYEELSRLTDEQLRRVVKYQQIKVSDRIVELERIGGIGAARAPIYTGADIERMGTRELLQAIQSGRQFVTRPIVQVPQFKPDATGQIRVRERVIQELFDVYEGHVPLHYIVEAVDQVYEDGMGFDEVVRRAGEIIEHRHHEFSGRALSLISFYEVM